MYETSSGQPVVEDFIKKMQKATQAKLFRQLELLAEFGPELSMPHARPMGEGLYELRVRGGQEVRILYVFELEDHIYLLHGFVKKTQKTPRKEIELALRRSNEV